MTINDLNTTDLLVYACLKLHKIKDNQCFISQETIASKLKMSRPTVRKSIDNLRMAGYISTSNQGRLTIYEFAPYKSFEPFSPEFIYNDNISNASKAYLIALQQYMYKDLDGYGKTSFNDKQIAERVNLSERAVRKYNKELSDKGFLTTIKGDSLYPGSSITINNKVFHLNELGQAVVFALQKHEEEIKETKEKVNQNKIDIEELQLKYNKLEKLAIRLLKEKSVEQVELNNFTL